MLLFACDEYNFVPAEEDVISLVACFQSKYDSTYQERDWAVKKATKVASGNPTDWQSIVKRSEEAWQAFNLSEADLPLGMCYRVLYRTTPNGNDIGLWWMTDKGDSHEYEGRIDMLWRLREPTGLGDVTSRTVVRSSAFWR